MSVLAVSLSCVHAPPSTCATQHTAVAIEINQWKPTYQAGCRLVQEDEGGVLDQLHTHRHATLLPTTAALDADGFVANHHVGTWLQVLSRHTRCGGDTMQRQHVCSYQLLEDLLNTLEFLLLAHGGWQLEEGAGGDGFPNGGRSEQNVALLDIARELEKLLAVAGLAVDEDGATYGPAV